MKSGCGLPGRRTWKKLMVCVRPGVLLVGAILAPTSELMRLDLPTLERPRKAISGAPAGGNCRGSTAAATKRVRTFMPQLSPERHKSASGRKRAKQQSAAQIRHKKKARVWRAFMSVEDCELLVRRGGLFGR